MEWRWQDWMNLALGVWLFFSPFWLGYAGGMEATAAWNALLLGMAVVIVSAAALAKPALWQEWCNVALAAWLLIAPWILGFADDGVATWNHVLSGLIIGSSAIWATARSPRRVYYG